MTTEAYDRGRAAAFEGKPESANPYRPVNSAEYQDWLRGYRDAKEELKL
jgi:ribosome modulation factor